MTTDAVIKGALHAAAAEAARLGKGGEPISERRGLCWHLRTASAYELCALSGVLYRAFEAWPEFSGRSEYPVPHALFWPGEAYMLGNLWGTSEYADTRRRLCRHVAEYIERMIDNMYWEE